MAQGHPLFPGKKPNYLTVHRQFKDGRGNPLPGRLQGSRHMPNEIMEDSQIREKYGCGRFSVTARNEQGQLCGPPYVVDIPDEFGRVPMTEPNDGEGGGGGGSGDKITIRDLLHATEKRAEDQARLFMDALKASRDDRRNDLQFFSTAVESMAKAMAGGGGGGGQGESRAETALYKRLDAMEKELRDERKAALEWQTKWLKKGGDSSEWKEALDAAPQLIGLFKGATEPSGTGREAQEKITEELAELRALRERLKKELGRAEAVRVAYEEKLTAAGGKAPAEAAPVERQRPPLEEIAPEDFDTLMSRGAKLEDDVIAQFRAKHAEGKLPEGLVVVLKKHGVLSAA